MAASPWTVSSTSRCTTSSQMCLPTSKTCASESGAGRGVIYSGNIVRPAVCQACACTSGRKFEKWQLLSSWELAAKQALMWLLPLPPTDARLASEVKLLREVLGADVVPLLGNFVDNHVSLAAVVKQHSPTIWPGPVTAPMRDKTAPSLGLNVYPGLVPGSQCLQYRMTSLLSSCLAVCHTLHFSLQPILVLQLLPPHQLSLLRQPDTWCVAMHACVVLGPCCRTSPASSPCSLILHCSKMPSHGCCWLRASP